MRHTFPVYRIYFLVLCVLKNIIPKAHIVQPAYAWVTKRGGVIAVREVGGAKFNKTFDLWQTIADHRIQ